MNRRDVLKLSSLIPLVTPWIAASSPSFSGERTDTNKPNVLILVFDALSALDVSLYGFPRDTMPNLARFADRSTVYHAHYSGGNFTSPGTASILTGTYPWTHRAFQLFSTALEEHTSRNLFGEFGGSKYTRIAFSHNIYANALLFQFKQQLDRFLPPSSGCLLDYNFTENLFRTDLDIAIQSEYRYLNKPGKPSNSLFIYPLILAIKKFMDQVFLDRMNARYPLGIPNLNNLFYPLEDAIDWIVDQIPTWPQPFLAYLHMMPPHHPYCPREDFVDIFQDGWKPIEKPDHFFSIPRNLQYYLNIERQRYDEYISYVDAEFSRLHDYLESNGDYENTIVVFTSDHGEMFERKIWKHTTPTLFQPIVRVPLLISLPGQTTRQDVYTATSCVDLLPTLLHLTKRPIPTWTEGVVLPPFAQQDAPSDRSLFIVEAKSNPKMQPLRNATLAMIKGDFKLIHYRGFEGYDDVYELYNLHEDPEELNNLYPTHPSITDELQQELLTTIAERDEPFTKSQRE